MTAYERNLENTVLRPVLFGLAAAFLHSVIFYPGMLLWDTQVQLDEVLRRQFTDEHPPIIAAIFLLLSKIGIGTGGIFVLQEMLFWTGLALLLNGLFLRAFPGEGGVFAGRLLPGALLAAFSLPLTPYTFYAATIGKDTWITIALLWGLHHFLAMNNSGAGARRCILMSLCFSLAASFRHNGVVLLPVACCAVFFCAKGARRLYTFVPLPVVLFALISVTLSSTLTIERRHLVRIIYAFDLLGYEAVFGGADGHLQFLDPFLKPGFREHFKFGHISSIVYYDNDIADPSLAAPGNYPALKNEYFETLRSHPFRMASVKTRAFAAALGLDWSWSVVSGSFQPTPGTETIIDREHPAAGAFLRAFNWIAYKRGCRTILLSHAPWLALNLLAAGWMAVIGLRGGDGSRSALGWLILLCFPLSYTFSYLLACPSADYRYIMPSTFVLQAMAFVFVAGLLHRVFMARRRIGERSSAGNA